jgi:DNA polymerase-1
MAEEIRTLCIVDASAYVFRAYHAIRGLTNSKGMSTNAIFGYVNTILKAVRQLNPTHVAVAMDSVGKSFRYGIYESYKANRPPIPADLREQLPYIEPVTAALGLAPVRVEGFEADDVIATLALRAREAGLRVVVITGDKDLMQLVSPGIGLFDPMKDKWWDRNAVVEKFGVPPEKVGDLLAIMGDSTDNVPGVKGIGPKGAAALLERFGTLENLLGQVDQLAPGKQQEALQQHRDEARLSRRLVELRTDVPVSQSLEDFARKERDTAKLRELFELFEFRSLLRDLLPSSQRAPSLFPMTTEAPGPAAEGQAAAVPQDPPGPAAASSVELSGDAMPPVKVVWTEADLSALVGSLAAAGRAAFDTETTSLRPMEAALVGISVCTGATDICYIPIAHKGAREQLPLGLVRERLSPFLGDPKYRKLGQHFKYDSLIFRNHGFPVAGLDFDTMLASYVLDPGRPSHSLDSLCAQFLGFKALSYKEVTSSGSGQVTFDYVPVSTAARYSGEDAWATWRLADKFAALLEQAGLTPLLRDVEIPVSAVLADMEFAGIAVDSGRLAELSAGFSERLQKLEQEVYAIAGFPFNLNSPKQLSEVLFDRLGLPKGKKTKTGYSTDAQVLEELSYQHPLPKKMLEHRTVAKLKSTYSDVLPTLVNPKTGRIHSSFNQTATATGRLSSSEPNLQNIPIREEEGRRIREAFVAAKGEKFISADYSQIELRLLAHLAEDRVLVEAFRKGDDIHARTAADIFHTFPGMVTAQMRRLAKTINFGIIYGMSAYRLSREQGLTFKQAESFIEAYFARYNGVKAFLSRAVKEAEERGFAETILKRRRYLPDLLSTNKQVRGMAERMAINTPVQGGAADVVKLAMVALHRRLRDEGLPARILLQVHDELVVEADEGAAEAVAAVVRQTMESAYPLAVPLRVDLGVGDNWAQVHG